MRTLRSRPPRLPRLVRLAAVLGLLGGTLLTGALGAPPAEAHGGGLGTLAGLLGAAVLGAGLLLALIAWGGRGRHS